MLTIDKFYTQFFTLLGILKYGEGMSQLQVKAIKKHGRSLTAATRMTTKVIRHKHKVVKRKSTNQWLKEAQHER